MRSNLDLALNALQQEPCRVYSIECMFFLRMYWERCPEKQDTVRELVNEGRLRLNHSGATTADTLLPSVEALLRDCLIGQEWLRANGMTQEPRLAYLTDSFGASPGLLSLLRAAFLCDARERDLVPLGARDGAVRLTMPGTIATVRILT